LRKAYIILVLVIIFTLVLSFACSAVDGTISGKLESGDKSYTDLSGKYGEEELLDRYFYRRYWLKYKQKLEDGDYYYLKVQYYRKEYENETDYDNLSLKLDGNYTFYPGEKVRNKLIMTLKNKDYFHALYRSYNALKLKYQVDYDYSQESDYTIYLQRQWNNCLNHNYNDNIKDRLSVKWEYELNDNFDINTTYQVEEQLYRATSERSNKYSQKVSLGFKYDL